MNHQFVHIFNRLATGLMFPILVAVLGFNSIVSQALAETETNSPSVTAANNSTNASVISDMDNNFSNDDEKGGSGSGSNAGLIAGLIIPIVIIAVIVIVLVVIFKRRSRMMDNEKKMTIQMTSARNAGVYQDLTVTDAEKPPASPEQERLQSTEEV